MNSGENFGNVNTPTPELGSDEWISMMQHKLAEHEAKLAAAEKKAKAEQAQNIEPEVVVDLRSEHQQEKKEQENVEAAEEKAEEQTVSQAAIDEQATAPLTDENYQVWGEESYILNTPGAPEEWTEKENERNEQIRQDAIENVESPAEVEKVSYEAQIKALSEKIDKLTDVIIKSNEENQQLKEEIKQLTRRVDDGSIAFDILQNRYQDNLDEIEKDADIVDGYAEMPVEVEKAKGRLKQKNGKFGRFKKIAFISTLVLTLLASSNTVIIAEDTEDKPTNKQNIEQTENEDTYELDYNEFNIGYNYDGVFGGGDGYGYNSQKAGKYQFASGDVLGDVWQNEEGTRSKLVELVTRQPNLNGADYLCQLSNKDLEKIEMTEKYGTDLAMISKWMVEDKETNENAIGLLKQLIEDKGTKISFGRLTDFAKAGMYHNALGKIVNETAENDTKNVEIVACETYEDGNTAVVVVDTGNSKIMIKAGHFDENGEYIKDGCAQAISIKSEVYKNVKKVKDTEPKRRDKDNEKPDDDTGGDEPTPEPAPEPTPEPAPEPKPEPAPEPKPEPEETIRQKDADNLERTVEQAPTQGEATQMPNVENNRQNPRTTVTENAGSKTMTIETSNGETYTTTIDANKVGENAVGDDSTQRAADASENKTAPTIEEGNDYIDSLNQQR